MQYCKQTDKEVLEAVITEQSQLKASVKLGISRGTMSNIMNANIQTSEKRRHTQHTKMFKDIK